MGSNRPCSALEGIVPALKPFPKCLEGQDHASDVRVWPVAAPHLGEVIEEVAHIRSSRHIHGVKHPRTSDFGQTRIIRVCPTFGTLLTS